MLKKPEKAFHIPPNVNFLTDWESVLQEQLIANRKSTIARWWTFLRSV